MISITTVSIVIVVIYVLASTLEDRTLTVLRYMS